MEKQRGFNRRIVIPLVIVAALVIIIAICLTVFNRNKTEILMALCMPELRENVQVNIEKTDLWVWGTFPDAEIELLHPVIHVPVPDSVTIAGVYQPFPHSDTLFAADTLRLRICLTELMNNHIHIRSAHISRPHVYVTQYDSTANYEILADDEEEDTIPSAPIKVEWEQVSLTDGRAFYASDSLGICGIEADSVYISSNGLYSDSTWSVYADAQLRCEDAQVKAKGLVSDSLDIRAYVSVPHIEQTIQLIPEAIRRKALQQNELRGRLRTFAAAKGYYTDGRIPRMHAFILLDSLHGGHPDRKVALDQLTLRAEAKYHPDCKDSTFFHIDTLKFRSGSSWLYGHGQAYYREDREWVQLDMQSDLHLNELVELAGLQDSIRARGRVKADVSTYFYLDDLLQRRIYDIHSSSTIQGDNVRVGVRRAKTLFEVDSLRGEFKTNMEHKSRRNGRIDTALFRMFVAFRQMTVKYNYTDSIHMDSTKLFVFADSLHNSTSPLLHAGLSIYGVDARSKDKENVRVRARRLRVSAGIRPYEQARFVPQFTARLAVDSMAADMPRKAILQDSVRIKLNIIPRYRRYYRDSITNARILIPDSVRQPMGVDSLLRLVNRMTNDTLTIEKSFLKYFRTYGDIRARRVGIWHQADDLRPTLSRLALSLEDTVIRIDTCRLRIGRSRLSLKGNIQHLRGYLLRGRTLDAQLQLRSRRIDLNQLTNTITKHQQIREKEMETDDAEKKKAMPAGPVMTDEMDADSLKTEELNRQLIVIPQNLNVSFKAEVDTVFFADMRLREFKGNVRVQDQALSITNMSTSSKVGKMNMHVLYTCRDTSHADISYSLEMDSMKIEDLIRSVPKVDSLMPMLHAFEGTVTNKMAAELRLNSDMSIDLPSINAGMKLRGQELVLLDGKTFSEIADRFHFKKKTKNIIDTLNVEMMVVNNELRILPFNLSMDKYCVHIAGLHNLDGCFNYRFELLRPINTDISSTGLNVSGTNMEDIKYKYGAPEINEDCAGTKIKIKKKDKHVVRENDINAITNMLERIRTFILNVGQKN